MISVLLIIVGVVSSAVVGRTDSGQIDVQKTIEDRNQRIRSNTANSQDLKNSEVEIPVQNTNTSKKPEGGLKGRGTGGAPPVIVHPPEIEAASSTASSSDDTASSTGEIKEEVNGENI